MIKKILLVMFSLGIKSLWLPATVSGLMGGTIHVRDINALVMLVMLFAAFVFVTGIFVYIPLTDRTDRGHWVLSISVGLDCMCVGFGVLAFAATNFFANYALMSSQTATAALFVAGLALFSCGLLATVRVGPLYAVLGKYFFPVSAC